MHSRVAAHPATWRVSMNMAAAGVATATEDDASSKRKYVVQDYAKLACEQASNPRWGKKDMDLDWGTGIDE